MNRKFAKILLISFGIAISIEQGFTIILGYLRTGIPRGADILMPIDLVCYALLLFKPHKKTHFKRRWLVYFGVGMALFYLIWSFTGEFVAFEKADFRFGYVHLARSILIFVTIMTRVQTRDDVIDITKGVVYALGFQALIGVWQWQIGPVSLPYFDINNTWRSTGTIGVPNAYGLYMAALSPLAIRLAMFTRLKPKWLWIVISVLSMGALFASFTRGAWLAFAGAMIVFFAVDFKDRKLNRKQFYSLLAAILISVSFTFVKYGHIIMDRMSGAEEAIISTKKHSRINLARDAFRIIGEHGVTGVGLNNYRYFADRGIQGTRIVHNVYLLIAAQQGIVGIVIFLVLNLTFFFYGLRIIKTRDGILYHIGVAGLTSMLVCMVYYLVAPDYRLVPIKLQHWRILAMLAVILIADYEHKIHLYQRRLKRQNGNGWRSRTVRAPRHEATP